MPAAATLIGMRLESFAAGEALVVLDATAAHANPMGTGAGRHPRRGGGRGHGLGLS